ncbi:MAG TPA: LON peptidase substrate-binding domain-containing protein, partial [Tepidisphaeraceae bacterium]|nr:LON peptidase substrate-binding domain-containing protein [Tepidisphaeraceae bacterium]
ESAGFRVPLFPLPNVVLFPRAILPLHIFEERYKAMTADALSGDRRVAMALLREGWEKEYRPPIEPVVCVGRIISCERLPDGRYNFLLQGMARARILREIRPDRLYRTAELSPLDEAAVMEIDVANERQRLMTIFCRGMLGESKIGRHFTEMLNGPLNTTEIADLMAFHLIEDVCVKQSLLADGDPARRVKKVVQWLEDCSATIEAAAMARVGNAALN